MLVPMSRTILVEGDITRPRVDASVNAANSTSLSGDGWTKPFTRGRPRTCGRLPGGRATVEACITPG
jgi:hypothetical protein